MGVARTFGCLTAGAFAGLLAASGVCAQSPKPLPVPVVERAPGIHPLGRGRHTWWGVHMYDATLWIAGVQFAPSEPHALDLEPGTSASGELLVRSAIDEMRRQKVGDEGKLLAWANEMKQVIPRVQRGDQIVIFCPADNETLVYCNGVQRGVLEDPTLCPAIMNVWLHPSTRHQQVRKGLLGK
jgi:hypothetical protein